MAPRHVPRSLQVNYQRHRPARSRFPQHVNSIGDVVVCEEVPSYAATRAPRTIKDKMNASQALKSGYTGFSLPTGSIGTIVYPLSEREAELLYSMGADLQEDGSSEEDGPEAYSDQGAVNVREVAYDEEEPYLGTWMLAIMLQ